MEEIENTVETAEYTAKLPKKRRIWELDFLRGLLIVLMVFDHLIITVSVEYGPEWVWLSAGADNGFTRFYDFSNWYYFLYARQIIWTTVVFKFIGLCGLSCGFSRNNLKRGCQLALVALAYSAVSRALPDSGLFVSFGILHLLSFCILIWALISALTKNNKKINLIISLLITFTIAGLWFAAQKDASLKQDIGNSLYILIETDATFKLSPGDFYPLIPWAAAFFLCAGLSPYLYPDRTSHFKMLDGKWHRPVTFIGRHTLWIYALHLAVISLILELVSYAAFHQWILF